jgi:hypothetical protein
MAALAFVAGIASTLVLIAYITLRTAYSPDVLLGRVGSTARVLSLGMQPVGMLATGALIDLTSGSTALVAIGVLLIAGSVVFAPSRGRRAASLDGR